MNVLFPGEAVLTFHLGLLDTSLKKWWISVSRGQSYFISPVTARTFALSRGLLGTPVKKEAGFNQLNTWIGIHSEARWKPRVTWKKKKRVCFFTKMSNHRHHLTRTKMILEKFFFFFFREIFCHRVALFNTIKRFDLSLRCRLGYPPECYSPMPQRSGRDGSGDACESPALIGTGNC